MLGVVTGVFCLGSKSLYKTWVAELPWMLGGDDGENNTAGVWILLGLGIDHCWVIKNNWQDSNLFTFIHFVETFSSINWQRSQ